METLLGHWDGYAGNANDYYLFFSPDSQRFELIPWGLDQAFVGQRPFSSDFYDITVYARGRLARRLPDPAPTRATISLSGRLEDGRSVLLLLLLPRAHLAPGSCPFHGSETLGVAGVVGVEGSFTTLGLSGDGQLSFERAGTTASAPIIGELRAVLYQSACLGSPG